MNHGSSNMVGVEVFLKTPETFLKVKETLTRFGLAEEGTTNLHQTCFILHKKGRYFVVHYKELQILDGANSVLDPYEAKMRNLAAFLLEAWGLVELDAPIHETNRLDVGDVTILRFSEKTRWNLIPKYVVGIRH